MTFIALAVGLIILVMAVIFYTVLRHIPNETVGNDNAAVTPVVHPSFNLLFALSCLVLVPLATFVLYGVIGAPAWWQATPPRAEVRNNAATPPPDPAAMVERLAQRLRANPEDSAGWLRLAHAYGVLQNYDKAAEAYENAGQAIYDNADYLIDYAFVLSTLNQGNFTQKAIDLLEDAYELDDSNPKVLTLLAINARQNRQFDQAKKYLQQALTYLTPESEEAKLLQQALSDLQQNLEDAQ